jgi:hypothetical protein
MVKKLLTYTFIVLSFSVTLDLFSEFNKSAFNNLEKSNKIECGINLVDAEYENHEFSINSSIDLKVYQKQEKPNNEISIDFISTYLSSIWQPPKFNS